MSENKGDLISREVLKETLAREIKTNDMGLWLKILLVIDNAPTIGPEKTQGVWIFKNGKYRCNICGQRAIYRFSGSGSILPTELLTDFCSKCGAKMFIPKRDANNG